MVSTRDGSRCPNCLGLWEGGGSCPRCFPWEALDGAAAAVDMEGAARRVVHGLKYRGIRALAALMAGAMEPLAASHPVDAVLAVPLHRSRLRSRGFNQAEVLLDRLGWPVAEGRLVRRRKTSTQVGLRLRERRTNVAGAFSYAGPPLNGLRLGLVDDVITTGATANECARVLRDHGARSVTAFAFARANYDPSRNDPISD
jgi:ComF family protein